MLSGRLLRQGDMEPSPALLTFLTDLARRARATVARRGTNADLAPVAS